MLKTEKLGMVNTLKFGEIPIQITDALLKEFTKAPCGTLARIEESYSLRELIASGVSRLDQFADVGIIYIEKDIIAVASESSLTFMYVDEKI